MKYITTTQLRTKSKELVQALRDGESVTLVHRSQQVGTIQPHQEDPEYKTVDVEELKAAVRDLDLELPDSLEEQDAMYRGEMVRKHGAYLSRR